MRIGIEQPLRRQVAADGEQAVRVAQGLCGRRKRCRWIGIEQKGEMARHLRSVGQLASRLR